MTLETICNPFGSVLHSQIGEQGSLNDTRALVKSDTLLIMLEGSLDLKASKNETNCRKLNWMCFLVEGAHPKITFFATTYYVPTDAETHVMLKSTSQAS